MKKDILRLAPFSVTTIIVFVFFPLSSAFAENGKSNRFFESKTFKLCQQERWADALKAFRRDISTTWRDPNAEYCYAATLLNLGKGSEALKVLERLTRQYPRSEAAKRASSFILALNETGQSLLTWDTDTGILGLKFKVKNGRFPEIASVFSDTPAERAHLQEGDLLTKINNSPTRNLTTVNIANLLSGRPETKVTLTIKRSNTTFRSVLTRMHSKEFARAHPAILQIYVPPDQQSAKP